MTLSGWDPDPWGLVSFLGEELWTEAKRLGGMRAGSPGRMEVGMEIRLPATNGQVENSISEGPWPYPYLDVELLTLLLF